MKTVKNVTIKGQYAYLLAKSKKNNAIISVAIRLNDLQGICTPCSHCGRLIPLGQMEHKRNVHLCPSCASKYRKCANCGKLYSIADMENIMENYHGHLYCPECINKVKEQIIAPYHESRGAIFYSEKPSPLPIEGKLYMGMEIEMPLVGSHNWKLAEKLVKNNFQKFEHDLSIFNGFELITDAMTMEFWCQKGFDSISKSIQLAKTQCFTEHPSGGIHIHFSNSPFTKQQLVKIGLFVMLNYVDLIRFGRRDPDELGYCMKPKIVPKINFCTVNQNHDCAINFQHKKHTELRFFATSTDVNHIKAIVEFTYSLCMTALKDKRYIEWTDIEETATTSGICPHFLEEYKNNFINEVNKEYDYSAI